MTAPIPQENAMTRLALAALIALTPTLAAAWGKTNYYSYSSDRSATYTTESNNKGADDSTTPTTTSETTVTADTGE
ncbi:hypothetical protein JQU17_16595 [Ponticoccus sp. SC2-23]|nr:hypothetical protein [Ponticoccus sp. SC6-9]MBM1225546.1 hypothetical protein [Ponticoccus sp. SC6-15]MBM1236388.1 hypothetical protein [Ponticoccus sp. SC6-45]MBM1243469.1 hypothetical protein [Ponticoccus sp. SC2-64]MBM1249888.1 hypothetical protein [Ponticoccus sp. SC6-42]MBM1270216.1 hypothetical protein [Ponticoccus sp. SC2-37]MBM1302060.1 hypothetical protein [Ponticoccus sp. SC2-35]MBM1307303.1 hypothetical protein [Ponticoccus sp. SC2-23]MBM1318222.1 hypothetical protein [Pontico